MLLDGAARKAKAPTMKSINSRRGGGGSGSVGPSWRPASIGWKHVFLAAFAILAGLSVHLSGQIFSGDERNLTVHPYSSAGTASDLIAPPFDGKSKNHDAESLQEKERQNDRRNQNHRAVIGANQPAQEGKIAVSQNYLEHLRSLQAFPKKLHILFPHKDYYKREPPLNFVKHTILRFMDLNPSWNVTVYDDRDMDFVIAKAADDGIISASEKINLLGNATIPAAHPVERADLARLLLIWYYGGLYVDADALQNPKDFTRVFQPTTKMCLPIFLASNFAQSIVCSSRGNRLYLEIIQGMSKHRMKSNLGRPIERRGGWASSNSLFSMGPPLFNRMVFRVVFGEDNSGTGDIPGIENYMRALKNQAGDVIATGQFFNYCNSFIADPYKDCKERNREELYNLYNMSSWGKAVNKRWTADT